MKKYILIAIFCFSFLFTSTSNTYASKIDTLKNQSLELKYNDDKEMIECLNKFKNSNSKEILSYNGKNLTNIYLKELLYYIQKNEYDKAINLIYSKNLIISYEHIEYSVERTALAKHVYRDFTTKSKSENYPSIVKSWTVRLKGTIYYDQNKKYITGLSNPTLSVVKNPQGAAFSPILDDVSTSKNKIDDFHASFSASYRLNCKLYVNVSGRQVVKLVMFPPQHIYFKSGV